MPAAFFVRRSATSAGFSARIVSAIVFTNAWKSAFFATKSVSAFTSSATPVLSSEYATATPSAAILDAFLAAFASPCSLKKSIALSISPSASVRAFLQSIIPQPVFCLNVITSFAVKAILKTSKYIFLQKIPAKHLAGILFIYYSSTASSSVSSTAAAPILPSLPSMIAFAIADAISFTARIASSLPGIT